MTCSCERHCHSNVKYNLKYKLSNCTQLHVRYSSCFDGIQENERMYVGMRWYTVRRCHLRTCFYSWETKLRWLPAAKSLLYVNNYSTVKFFGLLAELLVQLSPQRPWSFARHASRWNSLMMMMLTWSKAVRVCLCVNQSYTNHNRYMQTAL